MRVPEPSPNVWGAFKPVAEGLRYDSLNGDALPHRT